MGPGALTPGMMVGPGSLSGVWITPETALTFTAVYAAIRVLSEDTASLPLQVYRATGKGRKPQKDHPVNRLLATSPDGEVTSMSFREALMGHCLGWGNGYAELEWSRGGELLAMHLLPPGQTEPKRRPDKSLYYETKDGSETKSLRPDQVWHLAAIGYNGLSGYSPIRLARDAVGLGKAAEAFGGSFFGNSAIPKGALEVPTTLSDKAAAQLRDDFQSIHGGVANAHRLMVLEGGAKWVNTQVNPEDAQFLSTRQFQVVEIARIFRLPPHKLGDYSQAHLANVEASNLDYLVTCLRPWLVRIEESANLRLFSEAEREAGFHVKHDMRALLRASSKDRADYYTKMRDLGAFNVDQILELEDLNPIGEEAGGQARFVQLNMTTLEAAAHPPEPEPAAETPAEPPAGPGQEPEQPPKSEPAPAADEPKPAPKPKRTDLHWAADYRTMMEPSNA
jgi:HK97 family phage portal protein